jgi:hypothetical protein
VGVFKTKKFVPVVEGTSVNVPEGPLGDGVVDTVVPNATGVPSWVEFSAVEEDFEDAKGVPVKPSNGVISKLSASRVAIIMISGSRGPKAGSPGFPP